MPIRATLVLLTIAAFLPVAAPAQNPVPSYPA